MSKDICPYCKREMQHIFDYPSIRLISVERKQIPQNIRFPFSDPTVFILPPDWRKQATDSSQVNTPTDCSATKVCIEKNEYVPKEVVDYVLEHYREYLEECVSVRVGDFTDGWKWMGSPVWSGDSVISQGKFRRFRESNKKEALPYLEQYLNELEQKVGTYIHPDLLQGTLEVAHPSASPPLFLDLSSLPHVLDNRLYLKLPRTDSLLGFSKKPRSSSKKIKSIDVICIEPIGLGEWNTAPIATLEYKGRVTR